MPPRFESGSQVQQPRRTILALIPVNRSAFQVTDSKLSPHPHPTPPHMFCSHPNFRVPAKTEIMFEQKNKER